MHTDFLLTQKSFSENIFDDFEDLMILQSASRINSDIFITNDKNLLNLSNFNNITIQNSKG